MKGAMDLKVSNGMYLISVSLQSFPRETGR